MHLIIIIILECAPVNFLERDHKRMTSVYFRIDIQNEFVVYHNERGKIYKGSLLKIKLTFKNKVCFRCREYI